MKKARKRLRVGYVKVLDRIHAVHASADGLFFEDSVDVTSDVLAALVKYCPPGMERRIVVDGVPRFVLQIHPLDGAVRRRPRKSDTRLKRVWVWGRSVGKSVVGSLGQPGGAA